MTNFKTMDCGSIEHQLLKCCRHGTLEQVRELVDAGAEINSRVPYMDIEEIYLFGEEALCTPVHCAATNPDIRIIQFLVSRGADMNVSDAFGTPLHYAARGNTLEMVKYLVSFGNDPLEEDVNGNTMLEVSSCNPHKDVLEYFLQQGVDINGNSFVTPLGMATRYGTQADMDFFIERGADLEMALAYAYIFSPLENIRHLLEKGCKVNAVFDSDETRCDFTKITEEERRQLFLEFGAKSDEELKADKK